MSLILQKTKLRHFLIPLPVLESNLHFRHLTNLSRFLRLIELRERHCWPSRFRSVNFSFVGFDLDWFFFFFFFFWMFDVYVDGQAIVNQIIIEKIDLSWKQAFQTINSLQTTNDVSRQCLQNLLSIIRIKKAIFLM